MFRSTLQGTFVVVAIMGAACGSEHQDSTLHNRVKAERSTETLTKKPTKPEKGNKLINDKGRESEQSYHIIVKAEPRINEDEFIKYLNLRKTDGEQWRKESPHTAPSPAPRAKKLNNERQLEILQNRLEKLTGDKLVSSKNTSRFTVKLTSDEFAEVETWDEIESIAPDETVKK